MTKLSTSLILVWALAVSLGCGIVELAAQTATGTFERTLTVSGGPVDLSVRTGSGDITIRTGGDNAVRIIGRIRANERSGDGPAADRVREIEKNPPIEQNGPTIRIGDQRNDDLYRSVSISYEITVPANSQIHSQTGSGSQNIGSVRGSVTAQAGSGSIQIGETGGDVHVQAGSGSITVERAAGSLDAQAGSGSIRVRSVGGSVRAQAGSGAIEMTQTAKADADLRTGSGSVTLTVPRDAAFDFSARTGSGSIQLQHPTTSLNQSRHQLNATVRGGGSKINITTGSGAITVR